MSKPCINETCDFNVIKELSSVTYKNGCGANVKKLTKCNSYVAKMKKRPITVKELFECGASHMKDSQGIVYNIAEFHTKDNKLIATNAIFSIKEAMTADLQFTADRKTWHNFEVDA